MSFVSQTQSTAFDIAEQIIRTMNKAEPFEHPHAPKVGEAQLKKRGNTKQRDEWEFIIPLSPQVVSNRSSFYATFPLIHCALMAVTQESDKTAIRVAYSPDREAMVVQLHPRRPATGFSIPLQRTLQKLEDLKRSLSRDWHKDSEGNYRHCQTFLENRGYGFVVQPFSYGLLQDPNIELYREGEKPVTDPLKLSKTPQHLRSPDGICLTAEQLAFTAAAFGFANPALGKGQGA